MENSKNQNALVIDDTLFCLNRTVEVLQKEGWDVQSLHVTAANRSRFRPSSITTSPYLSQTLGNIDLLVCDGDLGGGVYSISWLVTVRKNFPNLKIVLFSGMRNDRFPTSDDWKFTLKNLGIYYFDKGRWFNKEIYPHASKRTWRSRGWSSSGSDGTYFRYYKEKILESDPRLDELQPQLWSDIETPLVSSVDIERMWDLLQKWDPVGEPEEWENYRKVKQKKELTAISKLSEDNPKQQVEGQDDYFFELQEEHLGGLTHQLGHAVCDGLLSEKEIEPFLPELKRFCNLPIMVKYIKTDLRFQPCGVFLQQGRPASELMAIRGTY